MSQEGTLYWDPWREAQQRREADEAKLKRKRRREASVPRRTDWVKKIYRALSAAEELDKPKTRRLRRLMARVREIPRGGVCPLCQKEARSFTVERTRTLRKLLKVELIPCCQPCWNLMATRGRFPALAHNGELGTWLAAHLAAKGVDAKTLAGQLGWAPSSVHALLRRKKPGYLQPGTFVALATQVRLEALRWWSAWRDALIKLGQREALPRTLQDVEPTRKVVPFRVLKKMKDRRFSDLQTFFRGVQSRVWEL